MSTDRLTNVSDLKSIFVFDYYDCNKFSKKRAEPYELRNNGEVWTLIVRHIKDGSFEEIYLSRMKSIEIKSKYFTRSELPHAFGKKYDGKPSYISLDGKTALVDFSDTSGVSVFINLETGDKILEISKEETEAGVDMVNGIVSVSSSNAGSARQITVYLPK